MAYIFQSQNIDMSILTKNKNYYEYVINNRSNASLCRNV